MFLLEPLDAGPEVALETGAPVLDVADATDEGGLAALFGASVETEPNMGGPSR